MLICLKLKAELYTVRATCKRHARQLILIYYPELSPHISLVLEWSQQNGVIIPESMAGNKEYLIRLYRKAKVADLTGVENQERKAKFIYDLSKLVSCLWLFIDATMIWAFVLAGPLRYSLVTTDPLSRIAIPSLRSFVSKPFTLAVVLAEHVAWLMLVQQDLGMMNASIQSPCRCWG